MEIDDLLTMEFKVTIIKMLNEHRRRVAEHSEKFNKEIKVIEKKQAEIVKLKNTMNEMKKHAIENIQYYTDQGEESVRLKTGTLKLFSWRRIKKRKTT